MGAGASSRVPLKKLSDGTLSAVQTLPAEAQQELLDWAAPRTPLEFFDDATLATAAAPSPEAEAAVATQVDTGQPMGIQAQGPPPTAAEEAAALLAADEARNQEDIAQPLPDDSDWNKLGGAELEPFFACTTIISAVWLLMLLDGKVMPERNGVVPPWQQVPDAAKLSLETLRKTTMIDRKSTLRTPVTS